MRERQVGPAGMAAIDARECAPVPRRLFAMRHHRKMRLSDAWCADDVKPESDGRDTICTLDEDSRGRIDAPVEVGVGAVNGLDRASETGVDRSREVEHAPLAPCVGIARRGVVGRHGITLGSDVGRVEEHRPDGRDHEGCAEDGPQTPRAQQLGQARRVEAH